VIADKPMQVNHGRFMLNGNCGYVLKPECMLREGFDPLDPNTLGMDMRCKLVSLKIIGARHLGRSGRSTTSPSVEVEILGADFDSGIKLTTRTICKYYICFHSLFTFLMGFGYSADLI